jgi:hypothetical protein
MLLLPTGTATVSTMDVAHHSVYKQATNKSGSIVSISDDKPYITGDTWPITKAIFIFTIAQPHRSDEPNMLPYNLMAVQW